MLEVSRLQKIDEEAWDEYVLKSNNSTFYHRIGWKTVIEETYKHRPIYLIAKEDDSVKGILPLFLMKSKLFGKKLVSVPFAPYGGVCADNKAVESVLLEEAKKLADEHDVDYLELRCRENFNFGFTTNDKYYTFILRLDRDPEMVWKKFSKKVRNSTRKAIKSNLQVERGKNYINDFYKIYSKNMHNLGTPTHSIQFFKNVLSEFPESTEIVVVKYNDFTIAGTILLYFKDTIISGWAASRREYLKLCPNNLMYWDVIKNGCKKGYRYFDFGRSLLDSGTFKFKKAWASEPKQLYYQYYLPNKAKRLPDTSMSNPKRNKFARIWRSLPHLITDFLGPSLRRNFP